MDLNAHKNLYLSKLATGSPIEGIEIYADRIIESNTKLLIDASPDDAGKIAGYQETIKAMKKLMGIRDDLEAYLSKMNLDKKSQT